MTANDDSNTKADEAPSGEHLNELTSVGTEVDDEKHSYPRDEFDVDVVPGQRRGAHRVATAPLVAALPWILAGLFALAVIVTIVTAYSGFGSTAEAPIVASHSASSKPTATASATGTATASASPTATVPPDVDKGVQLLVLNGTYTNSLTRKATKKLRDDGWIVTDTANNDDRRVAETFVVYKDPTLKDTADALATFLGGGTTNLDTTLPEDMRVVLGQNFKG